MKIKFKNAMQRSGRAPGVAGVAVGALLAASCRSADGAGQTGQATSLDTAASASIVPQTLRLDVSAVDTTFVTRDHFIASVEMQISGEPFAEAMGRQLAGFSRDYVCQSSVCSPSIYYDPALNNGVAGGPDRPHRSAGLRDRRRVVRVLEAADEQHRVRVGRGHVARVRAGAQSDGRDRRRRARGHCAAWVQQPRRRGQHDRALGHADRHADQPPRVAGLLADASAVHAVEPRDQGEQRVDAAAQSARTTIRARRGALHCNDYECDYTTLHLPDRRRR